MRSAIPGKERINIMRKSLLDLWPYDEATLFDLVLYDYDKATHFDEVSGAALEVAASQGSDLAGNPYTLAFCTGSDTRHRPLPVD